MVSQRKRVRELGITPGILPVGQWNAYGQYQYQTTNLRMVADLFVNNFGVAQSVVVPFSVSR